jgi:hypothetical protein
MPERRCATERDDSAVNHLDTFKAAAALLSTAQGLQVIEERHDAGHFGDALLVLAGPSIRVRLVADRGQVFADVADPAAPTKWYELRPVLREITDSKAMGPWRDADEAVAAIASHLLQLEKFLDAIRHGGSTSVRASI